MAAPGGPEMRGLVLASLALIGLGAGAAFAQDIDDDEGGCVYNRVVYPEGSELCQDGTLQRCDDGAWSPIGDCRKQPDQEPEGSGGDTVAPEQ